MKVMSVNAGSSTLKFQLFEMPEEVVIVSGNVEKIGSNSSFYTIKYGEEKVKKEINIKNHGEAVSIVLDELINLNIIKSINEIEIVGHRVLHGFDKYSKPVIINDEVMNDIDKFSILGPLHNPANLAGIKAVKEVLPNVMNVAVFDTAFHQTMPKESYIYATPYEYYEKYGVRKYGFHGISHNYLSVRINEILNKKDSKVIICHLGNGASISAVRDGKCIDTTMGLTPIAGLPMGTRCGDIDVSIIQYIMKQTGMSIDEVFEDLNKKSGFLGISGISSDSRDIEDAIENGNERAILAQNIYIRKVVSFIASYYVLLDGADAIVFSAGLGEKSIMTRKDIMTALKPLGVIINEDANNSRGEEKLVSDSNSSIACYVIPTNEELMIARDAYSFAK